MNIFKLFLLFFITILLNANEQKVEKVSLQLQWKHQFEFAGFYAAKEKGFYRDAGLDVEFIEFNKSTNIVDEVLSSRADYGLGYSSIIADYLDNKPIIFIANFFKQSPLVLITQKEITSLYQLKNSKIEGLSNNIHGITLYTMLSKFGIKQEDIETTPPTFSIEAFANKEVDAMSVFITHEPYLLNEAGIEYNVFDPVSYGTKYYDLNLFTSADEVLNNPLRVDRFKEASIRGWKYALEHKTEIVELILKKYNTQNKSKASLLFEAKQIEQIMLAKVHKIGSIDINRVRTIADSFVQAGFVHSVQDRDIKSFIYKDKKNLLNFAYDEKEFDYTLFWQLLLVLFLVAFLASLRYYDVRQSNKALKKLVAEELRKSRDKDKILFHQNKLASMGEMLENIAHQWRQPLSQINSSVLLIDTVLHENNFQNSAIEERLLEIESLTKYLSNTIDDFKDFFDKEKPKKTFVLKDIIEKSVYIVKGSLEKHNIEIDLNINENYKCSSYENELQHVIVVILNNAKDVLADRNSYKPHIQISAKVEDKFYIISICDNAGGMTSNTRDRVFEPYFTTKHKSQGSGLGLYMSKKIMQESLGGDLNVRDSELGVCFEIRLEVDDG